MIEYLRWNGMYLLIDWNSALAISDFMVIIQFSPVRLSLEKSGTG